MVTVDLLNAKVRKGSTCVLGQKFWGSGGVAAEFDQDWADRANAKMDGSDGVTPLMGGQGKRFTNLDAWK